MQSMQRLFSFTNILVFARFSTQNLETFDVSHAFLSLTIAKLSTHKKVCFFWPSLYIIIFIFMAIVSAVNAEGS